MYRPIYQYQYLLHPNISVVPKKWHMVLLRFLHPDDLKARQKTSSTTPEHKSFCRPLFIPHLTFSALSIVRALSQKTTGNCAFCLCRKTHTLPLPCVSSHHQNLVSSRCMWVLTARCPRSMHLTGVQRPNPNLLLSHACEQNVQKLSCKFT